MNGSVAGFPASKCGRFQDLTIGHSKPSIIHDPSGVVPSERNPVRTKAVFDLMEHGFSFYWDCILIGRFVSFWLSIRVTLRLLPLQLHYKVYVASIIYVIHIHIYNVENAF